jgi:hypothetical protein
MSEFESLRVIHGQSQMRTKARLQNCKVRQMARIWQSAISIDFDFWAGPELTEKRHEKGSSGRTRTYNPPVNRGLPCCCWELRIVAD